MGHKTTSALKYLFQVVILLFFDGIGKPTLKLFEKKFELDDME